MNQYEILMKRKQEENALLFNQLMYYDCMAIIGETQDKKNAYRLASCELRYKLSQEGINA